MSRRASRLRSPVVALLLAVVCGLLAACTADGDDAGSGAAAEGSNQGGELPAPLPAIELEPFDEGEPLDLAQLRGPAVVNLWASWCGPCRREMPILEEFAQKHEGDVVMLGIDFQDTNEEKARELVEETGVTYPLYTDLEGELDRLSPFPHLRGLPFLALVDEQGRVVEQQFVEIKSLEQLEELVETHLGVA